MSDIVESLVGAIYIDTQGSLPACEAFLEHLGLMAYLRRVMDENVALLHPKEELGQLADREKVRYELGKEGMGREQRLTCKVFVGERQVVRVGDGIGVMEVQTRAADGACRVLRERGWVVGGSNGGVGVEHGADLGSGAEEEEEEEQISEDDGLQESKKEKSHEGVIENERCQESDSDMYMTADE